nr:unnamed protein product [Callosobruchus chinensis]
MSATDFNHLLGLNSAKVRKKDTRMRKSITTDVRLAVTLRYLATGKLSCFIAFSLMKFMHIFFLGNPYKSLMFLFRNLQITITGIIPECCDARYDCLQARYLCYQFIYIYCEYCFFLEYT